MLFFCLLVAFEKQVNGGGMRKFWRAAKAPILDVKELSNGFDLCIHHTHIEFRVSARESLRLSDGIRQRICGALKVGALVAKGICYSEQDAAKARAAHLVFGREIRSAEERFAVGKQEARERPATLPGNGTDGGLVAGIHIGTLIAIHLHWHEMFVDDLGDFDVFVAFAVDDV